MLLRPRRLLIATVLAAALVATALGPRGPQPKASLTESARPPAAIPGNVTDTSRGRAAPASAPRPSSPGELFTVLEETRAAEWDRLLPAPSAATHYVRVNADLARGKSSPFWQAPGLGRVIVPLPAEGALSVVIETSDMLGAERFTSVGRVEGHPGSRALFSWNAGVLQATIDGPTLGSLVLRAATNELAQFYRIAPEKVTPCGGERPPSREAGYAARRAAALASPTATVPAIAAAADNPQRADVHVLMLYTPSVLATMSGAPRTAAIEGAFDLVIAKTNAVFAASLISARVRLVGVAETRYDESRSDGSKVQDDALTALADERDGQMDEIHALRDRVGADIVALALGRADFATSGLSFLLNLPDDPTNPEYAFSIVHYPVIAGTNVVPHEFGHVMGCAHDRPNALRGPGAFSFSYGYRFVGADNIQYHDIMSYPPGIELNYFSNPDVLAPAPASVPLGIAAGLPGESNTALTIERTSFVTSTYRLQAQAPANAGTLINVATRAHVGVGGEVLIGGFVVDGDSTARVLVRGAGPSLGTFGVAGALANPMLSVYSRGTRLAENDNWSAPVTGAASATEVAEAAARAGAFPFVPGSQDAAVLLTLPAGAYTAVLEGVGGTIGAGLIEAYDVGRTSARVINLSTRGYAGRDGREMVAGFVVSGAAGTTKRMLIRVLGPTLGRPPFQLTGVMDDPEMEVRNAAGEAIVRGDDWSSGSEGGVSLENDFHPLVETYGEKQIAATGLAPGNRREPCILADFPPGNYTVIVRPFERVDATSGTPQAAVPGVGIVEVYEIAR